MSTVLMAEIHARLRDAELSGGSALVWVSGGIDSVCLLHLLKDALSKGEISALEAVHVDHGLRPDSSEDAQFVKDLALGFGVPFHLVRLSPADFPPGMSIQEAARKARFARCEEVRRAQGLTFSALAHHSDDQAETVLFRLIRGTGPRGAAGMRHWAEPLFRPLLGVSKGQLLAFALERGITHREDSSNTTSKYSRNRVRNELLPLASEIAPGASGALVRYARLARDDDDYMTALAVEEFERLAIAEPEGYRFPAEELGGLAPPIARRVILSAVEKLGASLSRFDLAHLDSVVQLLSPGRGGRLAPVPGHVVFTTSGGWFWAADPARLADSAGISQETLLWGLSKGMRPPPEALSLRIPLGRPDGMISFRLRREGDRLGQKKVKDLLIEAAIPSWRKKLTLIAEDSVGTLAVFAPCRAFGIDEASGATLWLDSDWWRGAPSEGFDLP